MSLSKNVCVVVAAALFCMLTQNARAEKTDTITQYGITWKLSAPAEVGQFVTGDYYVVGELRSGLNHSAAGKRAQRKRVESTA